MFAMIDIVWFAAGGALVWLEKDRFLAWWHGAQATATKLRSEAAALEAKVATVQSAAAKAVSNVETAAKQA